MTEKLLPKVNHSEALKMIRSGEFIPFHIDWFSPKTGMMDTNYPEQYPDCSHILITNKVRVHWRDKRCHAALVIGDPNEPYPYPKFG